MPYMRFLSGFFESDDETEEEGEAIVAIEIDMEHTGADEPPKVPTAPPPPPPPAPPSEPEPAPTASAPPPPPPGPKAPPEPAPEVPPPAPKKVDTPIDKVRIARTLTKNPNNVQIVLVGAQLRAHPIGAKMGPLLADNPQWQEFFQGSGIDPVRDIDVMMLTGPMMRLSGQVVAVMKFSTDMNKVDQAVGSVIEKSKPHGRWFKDQAVRSGLGMGDGAERIFALVPEKKLLVVFPSPYPNAKQEKTLKRTKKLEEALEKADARTKAQLDNVKAGDDRDLLKYAKEGYAIDAYMVQPWKLFGKNGTVTVPVMGEVEVIPKTLKTGRVRVFPEGGGAEVEITFTAESADQATKDAEALNSIWPFAKMAASAKFNIELPDLKFEAKGTEVKGKSKVSESFLAAAFKLGEERTEEVRKKREAERKK